MSTLKVNTIQNTSADHSSTPEQISQGRAKAWVNFDGTFGTSPFTVSNGGIRDSFNVSSVTDHGSGDYTINFSSNMSNNDYSCVMQPSINNHNGTSHGVLYIYSEDTYTTSSIRLLVCNPGASSQGLDKEVVSAVIFGDT